MKQKIQVALEQLNHGMIGREAAINTALLALLAGENIVLIGPPGTGKSEIARRIAARFGDSYFEYLLTKFSTPEEIFGPLSIAELKKDRFWRNTESYLPTVRVAFLDEIFKASSSILNSLLTILNERKFHNGAEVQEIPLQGLIAASNELPTGQEELDALYDRFLMRSFVDYVSEDERHRFFEKTPELKIATQFTKSDLEKLKKKAASVAITPEIAEVIQRIWSEHKNIFKEDRREKLSDRRLVKVLQLLRVSAATNERDEVDLSDVFLLKDSLWNHQENAEKMQRLILDVLCAAPQNSVIAIAPTPQAENSVNGFKGNGTAEAPLLVGTLEELMDLSRPDVGLKGYHFRQTADIDCSAIESWAGFEFQGHYDGSGHTIKYQEPVMISGFGGSFHESTTELFSDISMKSSLANLSLENFGLAKTVTGSHINHCRSSGHIISEEAIGSTIKSCIAGGYLIAGSANECAITECKTGASIIKKTASRSAISDCLVIGKWNYDLLTSELGGVAGDLADSSATRCFVTGECKNAEGSFSFGNDKKFSGIANTCRSSTISQCATGELVSSLGIEIYRISRSADRESSLKNNASTIKKYTEIHGENGKNCQTVDKARFTQRFFEHTLGWNFDTIWEWDGQNNRPALRTTNAANPATEPASATAAGSLFEQQIRANIWL